VLPCDVADAEAVEAAAAAVERELGEIDVWVNCAMTAVLADVMETSPDEFRRVMEVNFLGCVHGAQAALRRMLPRDRGTVVFVGSALAERGIPLQATYCASKHATAGLFDSLRAELRHRRADVHLTMVHLPGLNTTQFGWVRARTDREPRPVAPVYAPEVAARAIVWAAAHRRRVIWVGLPTVYTIVGDRLASWYMDRYLANHGYDAQQTAEQIDGDRPDDLLRPLDNDADRGFRGPFGAEARDRSLQLEANLRRRALTLVAAAAVIVARRVLPVR
jgi:NAD(P)-dependent dehydrogenase (short-subunit alcohol dehydrogenase family)